MKIQFVPHRDTNVLPIREAIFECCKEDAKIYRLDKLQGF
jgi:hypothetical protein